MNAWVPQPQCTRLQPAKRGNFRRHDTLVQQQNGGGDDDEISSMRIP